ncbi:AI-2E family transporter [Rhodoplanes sp. TEM]|uniref:AI-2E family transporter n=1 Tax=Rhodoplanes tepidamans TaxID=200616 RepID=A0ABT5J5L0_RHOTP|nr:MULTISPECIES: AI-2E family transporter [Rhodoplanes]MDC7784937.1 AI-2E family transporter [Rhodoplanes tepidamans]MDC7983967.1 AI-2E family transporter [Rhodoplanes sp. TEM]MDQ0353834.1 putative PurR-regulated permease PerM [Rhodoplanes tepidamans]
MSDPERSPAAQISPAESPKLSELLTLAVGVVVVAALYLARDVLVPITLAVLLTFVLAPLVRALRWLRLGRVPAVIVAVIVALAVLSSIGAVIGSQIASFAQDLPRYETTIRDKLEVVREQTLGRLTSVIAQIEQIRPGEAPGPAEPAAPQQTAPNGQNGQQAGQGGESDGPPSPLAFAQRWVSPVLSPLATLGIVLVFVTFILLQKEDLRDRFIRLFGSRDLHRTTVALNDAGRRLSTFFLTQLALNTAFGVLVTAGLYVIGLPSPILWGIVAALCRFVPYVGAWISTLLPLAVAAAVDPGWTMFLWTLALFLVTEPLLGQVVEPVVYGHSTGLSPVSVLIATVFWTWLWGPIGLVLATPLTLCLVVLGRHVERLEFLEVLLGDRPALTSTETFYQRMLAGDPDEVQDQAEVLLKTRSLSAYYDEVALRGLALAAEDAARGVLGPARIRTIAGSVCELVEELDEYDDHAPAPPIEGASPVEAEDEAAGDVPPGRMAPPPEARTGPWACPSPVLCIAGASPLDEAAAAMLMQLLGKHGLGARSLASDRLSRVHVAALNPDGIAYVCISLVESTGNLARVRYLIRRLRRQLPGVPILVGLWPDRDDGTEGESVRTTMGADLYVGSLTEAVNACVDAATATAVAQAATADTGAPRSGAPEQTPEPAPQSPLRAAAVP